MDPNYALLQTIPDGKPVRVFLSLLSDSEQVRLQGIFQPQEDADFTLTFKFGILPFPQAIDTKQPCIVTVDLGGSTLSLEAMIREIPNRQTLEMRMHRSINHEQMREFFRVDLEAPITVSAFHARVLDDDAAWSVSGTTADISGSGILARFTDSVPKSEQYELCIDLPFPEPESIKAVASTARNRKLPNGLHEIAFNFDEIETEARDKVIGCCLFIQRKMLRLKVQVKDLTK